MEPQRDRVRQPWAHAVHDRLCRDAELHQLSGQSGGEVLAVAPTMAPELSQRPPFLSAVAADVPQLARPQPGQHPRNAAPKLHPVYRGKPLQSCRGFLERQVRQNRCHRVGPGRNRSSSTTFRIASTEITTCIDAVAAMANGFVM